MRPNPSWPHCNSLAQSCLYCCLSRVIYDGGFLGKLTVQPRCTSSVHDTAKLLLAEDRPDSLGARERTLEVHGLHSIEFSVAHVLKAWNVAY
jgi:hypothetical protein